MLDVSVADVLVAVGPSARDRVDRFPVRSGNFPRDGSDLIR